MIKFAWRRTVLLICSVVLLASAGQTTAQAAPRRVRVELLAQTTSITPGRELSLAVHFHLEPGWHIYWINPGDSGQPPVLKWQLPAGLNAGEIQWPVPEKLRNSQLADYGYKDDVALLVPAQVLAGLREDSPVDIGLQANWLVCREVCLPERQQLHLSLPVARSSAQDPAHAALFSETRKMLPHPWPAKWKAEIRSTKDNFVLTLRLGSPVHHAEFFPLEASQIENAAPQELRTVPTGARLTLRKSDQLLMPIALLKGVLIVDGAAYQVQAPVMVNRE